MTALLAITLAILAGCTGDDEAASARITALENWARDYCGVVEDWASDSNSIDIAIGDADTFEAEQQRISTRWPAFIESSERAATALRSIDPPAEVQPLYAATVQLIEDQRDAITDSLPAVRSATSTQGLSDAALELQRRQQRGRRSATFDEFALAEDAGAILDRTTGSGFTPGPYPTDP